MNPAFVPAQLLFMNKNFLPVLALTLLTACDKNDSDTDTDTPDPKTTLITSGAWKYETSGIDVDRNGSLDAPLPVALPACAIDNSFTLAPNGTGSVDEGATKCDPSLPQTSAATWSFADNQTTLNLNGSGLFGVGGKFKLLELTATRLTLSKDTTAPGLPITVGLIVQFKH